MNGGRTREHVSIRPHRMVGAARAGVATKTPFSLERGSEKGAACPLRLVAKAHGHARQPSSAMRRASKACMAAQQQQEQGTSAGRATNALSVALVRVKKGMRVTWGADASHRAGERLNLKVKHGGHYCFAGCCFLSKRSTHTPNPHSRRIHASQSTEPPNHLGPWRPCHCRPRHATWPIPNIPEPLPHRHGWPLASRKSRRSWAAPCRAPESAPPQCSHRPSERLQVGRGDRERSGPFVDHVGHVSGTGGMAAAAA